MYIVFNTYKYFYIENFDHIVTRNEVSSAHLFVFISGSLRFFLTDIRTSNALADGVVSSGDGTFVSVGGSCLFMRTNL
jgi:hypothetical protein